MDPGEVDRAMQQGDGTPPTVIALSMAIMARLRELTADGPVVTQLDGCPVILELDGPVLIEHPLAASQLARSPQAAPARSPATQPPEPGSSGDADRGRLGQTVADDDGGL